MAGSDVAKMIPLIAQKLKVSKKNILIGDEKARRIIQKQEAIDKLIVEASQSYEFKRIQSVERNILRIAIFELLYDEEIPCKVAISEACRLCRKFSSSDGAGFINAILDSIYKNTDESQLEKKALPDNLD